MLRGYEVLECSLVDVVTLTNVDGTLTGASHFHSSTISGSASSMIAYFLEHLSPIAYFVH